MNRREFLAASASMLAAGAASAQQPPRRAVRPVPQVVPGRPVLLKGGTVLSLDPKIGDFDAADVLITGTKIAAVGPNLRNVPAGAVVIDASESIVMPGLVDTHRHMWEGQLRGILPDGRLSDYTRDITGTARATFRPEDARIGDLVSALGAINAGVTTVLDWSHIGNSPEHTDAAIDGLRESGLRAVYAFGGGAGGPKNQFPQDIRRLRRKYFSSSDQLLTLAMATGPDAASWAVAREVGAPITLHVNGEGSLMPLASAMRADCTYIHCNLLTDAEWRLIASTGGHVSIAAPIEMEMGHGIPPVQLALDHGIRPSLSVDVETEMPGDLFTQMRTVFTLQRMQAMARERAGEKNTPRLLTVREVVECATVQGAKDNALDHKVGSLAPGKDADLILLRHDRVNVTPLNNAYGSVALGMDTSNVDTVFIAGKMMKQNGELVGVDLARVNRMARESRDYILAKTGWPKTRVR